MGADAPAREVRVATDWSELADTAACPVLTIPPRTLEERPGRR